MKKCKMCGYVETKILPCPFCKSDKISISKNECFISCIECESYLPNEYLQDFEDIILSWNKRYRRVRGCVLPEQYSAGNMLSCPFCGFIGDLNLVHEIKEITEIGSSGTVYVECPNCFARIGKRIPDDYMKSESIRIDSIQQIASLWNGRKNK